MNKNIYQSERKYKKDVYPSPINYTKKTPYDKKIIPKKYQDFFDKLNFKEEIDTACRILNIKNDELAQDIFQDSLIKLLLTIKKKKYDDSQSSLRTYLRIIFKHTYFDYHRNNTKQKNWSTSHVTNSEWETINIFNTIQNWHNPEDLLINNEDQQINQKLYELLYSIPKWKKANTFYQYYIEQLSIAEIREQQWIPKNISTPRIELNRARIEIRKYLDTNPKIKEQLLSILRNEQTLVN